MFNLLKRNNPDDKEKHESAAESATTDPAVWKPVPEQPMEDLASTPKLPDESPTNNPDAFPTLAMPHSAAASPPIPELEPEPAQTTAFETGSVREEGSTPLYPPLPQKPKRHTLPEYVFSSETRSGRSVRAVLRWLAAITGLFALGLLAGFLMLYQPTQNELESTQLKLKQANQTVSQRDQSLQSAQVNRTQDQQSLQQVQADLTKAASENDLLMVLVSISNARVALVNKDGPAAKTAIEQAQADLTKTQAFIESSDKTKFDVLKARLDLAAKELVGDPQAAQTDLDKLSVDLNDLRQKLFKK